jgi:hypothetical protein
LPQLRSEMAHQSAGRLPYMHKAERLQYPSPAARLLRGLRTVTDVRAIEEGLEGSFGP